MAHDAGIAERTVLIEFDSFEQAVAAHESAAYQEALVASKGNHGGRPKVIDDDMLTFAQALKDKGVPVPEIAKRLTIKTGKNKDQHPLVASVYRALAEAEQRDAPDAEDLPAAPASGPSQLSTVEGIDLRERIISQRIDKPDLELNPS